MKKINFKQIGDIGYNIFLISLGSILCAVGINGILEPQKFLSGGVIGICLIIHYLIPAISVGSLYLALNIPLYILAWTHIGKRFFIYSVFGLVIFSGAMEFVKIKPIIQDKLLGAILSGIIIGIGAGITLKSAGSSGGSDILSVILLKKFSIKIGNTVLFFNSAIICASVVLFSIESALYTLIFFYVGSKIVDLVVTGLSQRKAAMIVSLKWEEILKEITNNLQRGVTILKGQGGYTGKEENVLYTVITFREVAKLKQIVSQIDKDAFVVITDTLEVIGYRIGNQPHW